jgi:hypothetical protein
MSSPLPSLLITPRRVCSCLSCVPPAANSPVRQRACDYNSPGPHSDAWPLRQTTAGTRTRCEQYQRLQFRGGLRNASLERLQLAVHAVQLGIAHRHLVLRQVQVRMPRSHGLQRLLRFEARVTQWCERAAGKLCYAPLSRTGAPAPGTQERSAASRLVSRAATTAQGRKRSWTSLGSTA